MMCMLVILFLFACAMPMVTIERCIIRLVVYHEVICIRKFSFLTEHLSFIA